MSRRRKPASPGATETAERLPLTRQQAQRIAETQAALKLAQGNANLAVRGVLDAAGIDGAEIMGGNVGDDPHLLVRRK